MNQEKIVTPLDIHNLNSLCLELVSGRYVVDNQDRKFGLDTKESRSIFFWYMENQEKWGKRNLKDDVEKIVDQLEIDAPKFPNVSNSAIDQEKNIYSLKSVKIHRFAGIHNYTDPDDHNKPPEDLFFEIEKDLTVIEGKNGAGKTSFLSAICWCLTGQVYRSQRKPETIEYSVPIEFIDMENREENLSCNISAITPIPPSDIRDKIDGDVIPVDTWVELLLINKTDGNSIKLRREIKSVKKGKITTHKYGFSDLKANPISIDIGTSMSGSIPYIELRKPSDFGKAIAELTGISPLKDLVIHAKKSQEKLNGELLSDRRNDINAITIEIDRDLNELAEYIDHYPYIKTEINILDIKLDKNTENEIDKLNSHFLKIETELLSHATSILGESFDPNDTEARQELKENVGPAIGQISEESLLLLPSLQGLFYLRDLEISDVTNIEKSIRRIIRESNELSELKNDSIKESRIKLYAAVAKWFKSINSESHDFDKCPICSNIIVGKIDSITGKSICEHIEQLFKEDKDFLGDTIGQWARKSEAELKEILPSSLQILINQEIPEKPSDMLFKSLISELFILKVFQGSLSIFKPIIASKLKNHLDNLKLFEKPDMIDFNENIKIETGQLLQIINKVCMLLAFSDWLKKNRAPMDEIIDDAIRKEVGKSPEDSTCDDLSLKGSLRALENIIENAAPIDTALKKINSISTNLNKIRSIEERMKLYQQTSIEIGKLFFLEELVEVVVSTLLNTLSESTIELKNKFYVPPYSDSPKVVDTIVKNKGEIDFVTTTRGTKASAYHINNASDLKATLVAFLLSFWKYMLSRRGGIALLLLDDVQEMFDPDNRRLLARCLPSLVEEDGQIICATNDVRFLRDIVSYKNINFRTDLGDFKHIHPLRKSRNHIELGPFREEIEVRRKNFESKENENEDRPARDYLKYVRIFIENRLIDILGDHLGLNSSKLTLSNLINNIRSKINSGQEVFCTQPFRNLVDDHCLRHDSEFLDLMNLSHHGREIEISYGQVLKVGNDCKRVCDFIDTCHDEYTRWLQRDELEEGEKLISLPSPISIGINEIPLYDDLAAFTTDSPQSESSLSSETFSWGEENKYAIYYLNTHNLGFSGKINYKVIVSLDESLEIPDSSLVIALRENKIYARRLHYYQNTQGMIGLSSEAENPKNRPNSLILPLRDTKLMKIVGIIFDDTPIFPKPQDEAVLVESYDIFNRIELAFRIVGDSAIPLALENQILIGGKTISANQFAENIGMAVATHTTEESYVKRVGDIIGPRAPHVRVFESIGGLGDSKLVRTESLEDDPYSDLPSLVSCREVLGVIYDT